MNETLQKIRQETLERLKAAKDESEIESLSVSVFGKSGSLTEILKSMGKLSKEERASVGQSVNAVKKELEKELSGRKAEIAARMQELRFEREAIDVTEPGKIAQPEGHLHPMTQTYRAIRDALVGMGFTTYEGPEVEYDDYNFTKLNLPLDHPARDMQDTFYINPELLLRSQTSPVQVRTMLKEKGKPIKIICAGKVYRRDADDATHSHQFVQCEGLVLGKDVTLADLKGALLEMAKKMLDKDRQIRLRPSFFPFTEPSVEVDVSCGMCGGKGCNTCKQTGWIEVLGAGMVNDNVLRMSGYDPNEIQGFAFGIGVERIAMLKYRIDDIRNFYTNDIRFLNQFKEVK